MLIVIKRGIVIFVMGLLFIFIALAFSVRSAPVVSFHHENIRTVIVDPGHGLPDGGAVSKTGVTESPLNLAIALKLKEELTERGYKVVLTREGEDGLDKKKKTDMYKRLDIMTETPCDMFVSIHINKFTQSKYRGAEVLYSSNFVQSTLLAQLIMDKIKEIDPKVQTRSIKQAEKSLFLMKNATVPAVIVECGFLSNAEETELLTQSTYQARIASAICDGIGEYYRNVEDYEKVNLIKSEDLN
ncbi:MAG: N-acetylmuramoyl-L-alanine amidase [Clostridia bacterium]|nr:N-acetylmuramoyl-L-alanine amidase [Clostridia bacterium]